MLWFVLTECDQFAAILNVDVIYPHVKSSFVPKLCDVIFYSFVPSIRIIERINFHFLTNLIESIKFKQDLNNYFTATFLNIILMLCKNSADIKAFFRINQGLNYLCNKTG